MTLEILDEVAFLFVEQFDNLYGMLVDRTDVKLMKVFHHKTKHWYFKVFFTVLLIVQVALLAAGIYILFHH